MNQPFHLFRLQQIDSQIFQVDAQITELDRLLAGNEAVRQAKANADEKTAFLQKARQVLKKAEQAVRDQNIKIEQAEASLYAGKVRNPKELQDIQKEIASFKKFLAQLEDQQLDAMMAVEEAEGKEKEALDFLTQVQAVFTEKSAGWKGQREALAKQRDRLLAERKPALTLVTPDSLQIYDRLRQRKNGVAVTTVREGSCTVCGATIRPAEVQVARASQDFVYCTNCGRILYAG